MLQLLLGGQCWRLSTFSAFNSQHCFRFWKGTSTAGYMRSGEVWIEVSRLEDEISQLYPWLLKQFRATPLDQKVPYVCIPNEDPIPHVRGLTTSMYHSSGMKSYIKDISLSMAPASSCRPSWHPKKHTWLIIIFAYTCHVLGLNPGAQSLTTQSAAK